MAKKKYASPFVLFTLDVEPEDPPVPGLASAHGSLGDDDAKSVGPMNYDAWLNNVGTELDGNQEKIDWGDYKQWFVNNKLDTNLMDPLSNPEG